MLDHLRDKHISLAKKNDNYLKPDAIAKRLGEGHHYTTVMKFLSQIRASLLPVIRKRRFLNIGRELDGAWRHSSILLSRTGKLVTFLTSP